MQFPQLTNNIKFTHEILQNNTIRAINQNITVRNWLIGLWIVEFEQNGEDRAKYGDKLLYKISKTISIKGLGTTILSQCRKFYLIYPNIRFEIRNYLSNYKDIFQSTIGELQLPDDNTINESIHGNTKIFQTASEKLPQVEPAKLFNNLSFSHFVELIYIENPLKRIFYEIETIKGCWSVKELSRQIESLCYERSSFSKNPERLLTIINNNANISTVTNIVKSPYVFEFLGIKNQDIVEENDFENILITHIQNFILELGDGFCFESRQKRILIDNEYFFIDLVFYHRILKCHILIELKTRKFNYADIAQLNMYVSYYREQIMRNDDNAPIGILLCTDASSEMVKYATAGMDENLFISKYLLQLPPKESLIEFLNNELKQL